MKQIEAAGGVILRHAEQGRQVLLIYRNGVWDLPKGKKEAGETMADCAVREVIEETGIGGVKLAGFIGETYHTYVLDEQEIAKKTYWYMMEPLADIAELKPQQEEGITSVAWVSLGDAVSLVGFENLKHILGNVQDMMG